MKFATVVISEAVGKHGDKSVLSTFTYILNQNVLVYYIYD